MIIEKLSILINYLNNKFIMGTTLRYTCIKNASSYFTSLFVDDEAYRRIGHDSDDKCECVFARARRERARLYTEQLCKVERRKWENIARGAGHDERGIIVGRT